MKITDETVAAYGGARIDLLQHVPTGVRSILDVGCFRGATGAAAKSDGPCRVVGVEHLATEAAIAAGIYDRVIIGDAESHDVIDQLRDERFDAILYGDVLEHLRDPWSTVAAHARLLTAGGIMVASLPNVQFYDVFVQVFVRGRWPRRDRGIFDRTHLRWFTRADALELFSDCGLRARIVAVHHRLVEGPHYRINRYAGVLRWIPIARRWFAFQYIVLASAGAS